MNRFVEVLTLVSILIIGYGAFLIYPPAGFLTVGLLLFVCCFLFLISPTQKKVK